MTSLLHPLYFTLYPQTAVVTPRAHGLDVSKYDKTFNPDLATGQIDFVIQRVSYRLTRDEAFDVLLPGVLKIPLRGGYHYLNSDTDWRAQADAYLSYVSGIPYHFHVCDFEGAYNALSTAFAYQTWQWIRYVAQKTGKPVILYTGKYPYQDWLVPSQRIYNIDWNTVPLWIAQYPFTPNVNGEPSLPTGRTSGWTFWQYTSSANGTMYGLGRPSAGDLDVFNGSVADLRNWLGIDAEPQDTVTQEYDGVRHVTGIRYGRSFSLVISDPKRVRFEVLHVDDADNRDIPTNIARKTGAAFVWNGGEWDKYSSPYFPSDLAVSNGRVRVPRKTAVPSLIFKQDGSAIIHHENVAGQWNVTSGLRYIVRNGMLPDYLNGTEPQYTDRRSRSIEGLDKDGHVMRLTVEGVYPNIGVTLKEAARLMVEYGCVTAFDTGGGGDTAEVMRGQLMNVPEDISNGVNVQRNVPEFLVLYAQENNAMANFYEYTATGDRRIRVSYGVKSAWIAANSTIYTGKVAKGGAEAADRHVFTAADVTSFGGQVGDVWVKVYDNNGASVNGWTALTHMGLPQLTERLVTVVPPPPTLQPFDVTVRIEAAGYAPATATITMTPL